MPDKVGIQTGTEQIASSKALLCSTRLELTPVILLSVEIFPKREVRATVIKKLLACPLGREKTENENGYTIHRGGDWSDVILPAIPSEQFTQSMFYLIKNLEPASQYEARVQAKNRFGWNEMSENFFFTTKGAADPDFRDLGVRSLNGSNKFTSSAVLIIILAALPKQLKKAVYVSVIRPVVTYGNETEFLTRKSEKVLNIVNCIKKSRIRWLTNLQKTESGISRRTFWNNTLVEDEVEGLPDCGDWKMWTKT
ncbi:unnamed protein product [Nezara viridula]|uniref:Uncharacterized protein n=1 Tax=Nezara viridula TaxID=85310 RepID=A0A9P0H860_NEZVI|nr:unnamed protein product [Nezara viridula]